MFDPETGHIATVGFGLYTEGYLHGEDYERALQEYRNGKDVALHGPEHRGNAPTLIMRDRGTNRGWWFRSYVSIYPNPEPAERLADLRRG